MNKAIILLSLLAVNTIFTYSLERESMEGIIFKQNTSEIIYTQKEIIKEYNNSRQIEHIYYRTDGSMAAQESVILINNELVYYETILDDLGMKGTIRREEDKMIISYNVDNILKERSIKWREGLVTGPMLGGFVIENRERVQQGEKIEFLLPFFDRQLLIPFRLNYIESEKSENEKEIIIEMKLKNFLLGMLVEPIEFVLDSYDGTIKEIHGPTILPDPQNSDKNQMLFADIFYSYEGAL